MTHTPKSSRGQKGKGWCRELQSGLCDNLEGWDKGGIKWEGGSGEGNICISMLMYGRNQHNVVKQLSSNKK